MPQQVAVDRILNWLLLGMQAAAASRRRYANPLDLGLLSIWQRCLSGLVNGPGVSLHGNLLDCASKLISAVC